MKKNLIMSIIILPREIWSGPRWGFTLNMWTNFKKLEKEKKRIFSSRMIINYSIFILLHDLFNFIYIRKEYNFLLTNFRFSQWNFYDEFYRERRYLDNFALPENHPSGESSLGEKHGIEGVPLVSGIPRIQPTSVLLLSGERSNQTIIITLNWTKVRNLRKRKKMYTWTIIHAVILNIIQIT